MMYIRKSGSKIKHWELEYSQADIKDKQIGIQQVTLETTHGSVNLVNFYRNSSKSTRRLYWTLSSSNQTKPTSMQSQAT